MGFNRRLSLAPPERRNRSNNSFAPSWMLWMSECVRAECWQSDKQNPLCHLCKGNQVVLLFEYAHFSAKIIVNHVCIRMMQIHMLFQWLWVPALWISHTTSSIIRRIVANHEAYQVTNVIRWLWVFCMLHVDSSTVTYSQLHTCLILSCSYQWCAYDMSYCLLILKLLMHYC